MKPPATVVISGASRGLGAALALRCAAPGVRLLLTARSASALDVVAERCRAVGAEVATAPLDITDAPAIAAALAAFGPVEMVIANAGTSAGTAPDGTPEPAAAAARQIAVNLIGAINLVGPLLPAMLARRSGRIGLIASVAGLRGLPDFPAYCASKAGLIAWGEGLRAAHGPAGLRVTVATPGFFQSAMGDRFHGARHGLLSTDAAAARIHAALLAGQPRLAFPPGLAVALRLLGFLPPALSDRLVRLQRYRVTPEA